MSDEFGKKLSNEDFLKKLFDDLDQLNDEASSEGEVAGAATGAGIGGAASFAALYGLGVPGFSAVGITSALAAAGSIVGGGMVAGVGVLAAPVAVLAVGGYALVNHNKQKRVRGLQRDVLAKAVSQQNAILQRLQRKHNLSEAAVAELRAKNEVLAQIIRKLRAKVGE